MLAKDFYSIEQKNPIPLHFITEKEWQSNLPDLTDKEQNQLHLQQFKGKLGEVGCLGSEEGLITKAYVGAGKGILDKALAYAATRLPPGSYLPQTSLSLSSQVMWALAQYHFISYKKKELPPPRALITEEKALGSILIDVEAVFLVRNLINTPTNDLGPEQLGEALANVAKQHDAYFKQWIGSELLEANFPAIHAVGRASVNMPRLLSLSWGKQEHPKVTIVGKGVCFDSGGLDIKPSHAMRLMKKDMGGAALAIGLAQWIMSHNLPIRLQVFIPAVENLIGPDAYKPGDVLKMRNGLNVEIDNTDAEGRLVLADALVKASEEEPELIIDFATLTGAARAAVGTEIAAMFSNRDEVAASITDVSLEVRDPVWRLPLFEDYNSMLDSSIADLSNATASPYAGAITAALFLQHFIPPSIAWVHFDFMAWNLSNKPGKPEGGEATALRAVGHYLRKRFL